MQPLADQILSFLLIAFLGMLMGVFYDCYRAIRQIWRPKVWGTILGDTVYWIVNTILAYLFLLYFIWGEVRFYIFLAMAAGLLIYLRFCSRRVSFLLLHGYLLLVEVICRIIPIILFPVRLVWRAVLLPFKFLAFFALLVLKGLGQITLLLRKVFGAKPGKPPTPPVIRG